MACQRPGLLPKFSRMHNGQGDFLAADGVHFCAENVFDLVLDAQGERQQVKDAGGDLVDHAGAQQELVADDVGIGGNFTQRLEEQFGYAHGMHLVGSLAVDWSTSRRSFDLA